MVRLPPAEKLSLVLRKNIRDEWDSKKPDYEKQLSELLGETWTIDINPNAIWPYHNDGYAKESVGSCIKDYVEGVIWQIKYQAEKYPHLAEELNTIASAHVLGMDVEDAEPKTFSYGSVGVQDGKLMMLFRPDALGSNISYATQEDQLFPALNAVPSDAPLSFLARHSIKTEYDAKIDAVQKSIATQIAKPDIKLIPNFEASFATLKTAADAKGSEVRDDWEKQLGYLIEQYFEGLDWQLKNIKIEEDDLIQEGFNEAVENGELVFRLVDTLKYGSYGEVVIEDGSLYLQASHSTREHHLTYSGPELTCVYTQALPSTFGSNVSYAAEKLVDQL